MKLINFTFLITSLLFCVSPTISIAQAVQLGTDINGLSAGDHAGWCMSFDASGHTVAIGAMDHSSYKGCAMIYSWNGTSWLPKGSPIVGEVNSEQCGRSVKLSADGSIVAVSSWWYNSGMGKVRIFQWNGTNWDQMGSTLLGEAQYVTYGVSIALSDDGHTLVVGATSDSGLNAGRTKVYNWDGSEWIQKGGDINGEMMGESAGCAVGISGNGNSVIVGAPMGGVSYNYAGRTRVYDWNGSAWIKRGTDIIGEAAQDQSGNSVDMSTDGNIVLIGSPNNDNEAGQVRVYEWNGTAWIQRGGDMEGDDAGDLLGITAGLSADGTTVVAGANRDDNGNGTDAGLVRLYDWDGTTWIKRPIDFLGAAPDDQRGWGVAINDDGSIFGCGEQNHDGTGINSGAGSVYLYCLLNTSVEKVGTTLTANISNATYQWINCSDNSLIAGETESSFTATTNGSYAVIITRGDCVDTSECTIINSVGLNEIMQSQFSIYPNPSNGKFALNLDKTYEHITINIYSVLGQLAYQSNFINSQKIELQPEIQTGIYELEIILNKQLISHNKIAIKTE